MTPVLIVMMNQLSQIGPIRQRLTKQRIEASVRGSEVPYDSSEPMIVWVVPQGSISSLLRVHGAFLFTHS